MKGRFALALVCVLGLAACASENAPDSTLITSLEQMRERVTGPEEAPTSPLTLDERISLSQQLVPSGPLILATPAREGTPSFLFLSWQNGRVSTLTTPDQQTVALRDGFLLNTRGLGYDLLSSDSLDSAALVAARAEGRATRMQETATVDLAGNRQTYACVIAPSGPEQITLPTGRRMLTTLMIENCSNATENFVNQYWVGSDGYIWQSRQWVGDRYGHIDFATIRR